MILHLKEDAKDFTAAWRIKDIVKRFSSFVPHPIRLGEGGEVLNDQKPIWVEPKSQVTEEQYTRFYQHLTHHPEETPLWHLHLAADSPIQFRAIVYCPPTNPERLGYTRLEHGLHLCAKRVLVQSECRELVPEYLRFLHGLVDSEDLPLNVSRETLQDNSVIRRIRTSIVKGVLDRLDNLAKDQPDTFKTFYSQFGSMLKEGLVVGGIDFANFQENRERIAKLLRFASSRSEDPSAMVSLDEYIARMPEGQKKIYYLGGPTSPRSPRAPTSRSSAAAGSKCFPHRPDRRVRHHLAGVYQGKELTSIDSADLDLPEADKGEIESRGTPAKESGYARVLDLFRAALGNRVSEVRESKRLIDSPCCLVNAEGGLSTQMQRHVEDGQQGVPRDRRGSSRSIRRRPLIRRLCNLSANAEHDDVHQAVCLAALVQRDDPRGRHTRPRGPDRPRAVVHGRGRREAVAADPVTSWRVAGMRRSYLPGA